MVTSSDAFTGANFRRGSSLDHADRYRRAEEEFLTMARQFWDSWVSDVDTGIYVEPSRIRAVEHHGTRFDVRGVTALRAGAAATLTPCSRCTRRWRPGSVITLMSKARIRRHRRSGADKPRHIRHQQVSAPRRSPCLSRYGATTFATTTPTAHCLISIRPATPAPPRGESPTVTRWP